MRRTSVSDALNSAAAVDHILVKGWVRTRRDSKGLSFLEVNDGSCLKNLQVVVDGTIPAYEHLTTVTTGAAVEVQGALIPSPGKGQLWEVKATHVTLLGAADPHTYPLQKKGHSDEFLREIGHLRPRTNKYGALFRIRSESAFAVHQFFRERGFYYVHTPIITGADCEGAGEMFVVTTLAGFNKGDAAAFTDDFFGKKAYLTVSGQLEAELFACALGKVYTFGPTFRAENSNTPRHAAEFWMVEPEMAFFDLKDNMDLAEAFLKRIFRDVLERCAEDMKFFNERIDNTAIATLEAIVQ